MSESTFPFGAADEPETGTDRKKLALVAGAGALAIALLGYFVVLPMLSGPADDSTALTVVHHPPKKATTAKKATAKKPAAQPASYADVAARQDPFKPLVAEQVAAPPATTTDTSGTATDAPASSQSVGGQRVILLHVYTKDGKQYAQTKVGDTVFTPYVGQTFATSYKLLAVSGTSATYLFGDEQFSLSEGQEVLK